MQAHNPHPPAWPPTPPPCCRSSIRRSSAFHLRFTPRQERIGRTFLDTKHASLAVVVVDDRLALRCHRNGAFRTIGETEKAPVAFIGKQHWSKGAPPARLAKDGVRDG